MQDEFMQYKNQMKYLTIDIKSYIMVEKLINAELFRLSFKI